MLRIFLLLILVSTVLSIMTCSNHVNRDEQKKSVVDSLTINENMSDRDTNSLGYSVKKDDSEYLVEKCDISVEKEIRDKFYDLALNVYYDNIFTDSLESEIMTAQIDTSKVNAVLKVFQLISNLNIPESDTIIKLLDIKHFSEKSLNRIDIYGSKFSKSLINLKQGIIPTGDNILDKILVKYDLKLKSAAYLEKNGKITIWSQRILNTYPVSIELMESVSVGSVSILNGIFYNTSDVKLSTKNDRTTIVFRYGSGDCISGCMRNRFWEFEIIECSVKFTKSYGDQISIPY